MSANIKVVVRPRPIDEAKKEKWTPGLEIHGRRISFGAKTYDPDCTLQPTATQSDVYDACRTIVDAVRCGSNGTIMVYGQTGTGKTHTMFGVGEEKGIAYRCIEELLTYVRDGVEAQKQVALTMSMLEIYNERIGDMLADDKEVFLINGLPRSCQKKVLNTIDGAFGEIQERLESRHISSTAMNDRSSRSHVILMLDLEELSEEGTKLDVSHLFLVDLAGSESIKKSCAVGKAAAEAGMINKSLLALKNVILTLSNATEATRPHVPYRDSKLTEMLQDSIGGTARTMLIACISCVGRDVEETKSTLDYATKARCIRNVANTERDKMQLKVRNLEIELQRCKNKLMDKFERGPVSISKEEFEENLATKEDLRVAKETIAELLKERTDIEARQHCIEGQVAILYGIIAQKDEEVQTLRTEQATALQQFQQTWSDMAEMSTRGMIKLENTIGEDWKRFHGDMEGWGQTAPEAAIFDSKEGAEQLCARATFMFQDMCTKMIGRVENLSSELLHQVESHENDLQNSFEALGSYVASSLKDMGAACKRHRNVTSATARMAQETAQAVGRSALAPVALPEINCIVERAAHHMMDSAKVVMMDHVVPQATMSTLEEVREQVGRPPVAVIASAASSVGGSLREVGATPRPTTAPHRATLGPQKENIVGGIPVGAKRTRSSAAEGDPTTTAEERRRARFTGSTAGLTK